MIFFLEQRAINKSSYGVGNIMCWNMLTFYSMNVFWYLSISFYLFLHMFFIYLLIYWFFFKTGWNPFSSAVSTMKDWKDCKDSKFCTSPGAWRRFLRQQAHQNTRWNHPRSLQKWVHPWSMMMKTNTKTVGSCEIVSHDIHLYARFNTRIKVFWIMDRCVAWIGFENSNLDFLQVRGS